jgi:uncharacterized membrane protein YdbT with pleckstrin-like domain
MAYFDTVKQPDEQLVFQGKIHWSVYVTSIVMMVFGLMMAISSVPIFGVFLLFLAFIAWVKAFLKRLTTEIVVTDKRVLIKKRLIARQTQEMNLSKIETVDLRQSIVQRMLGAGFVIVRGTGGTWEPIGPIEAPLRLRNAIVVG